NGTIQQINVTPVSRIGFILAKLIPFWIVGLVVMIISVTVTYLMYGLWPAGSMLAVLFSAIVFIFSISGLGIIISNYSENMQQASFLVMFFILILILLGGMFTPVSSMPSWARVIAAVNPFNYLTKTLDRKSTRLNSSHVKISYAVFCLKKKTTQETDTDS